MYFSYDPHNVVNLFPLSGERVRDILSMNRKGIKPDSLKEKEPDVRETDFISAVGDDSISRFDEKRRSRRKKDNKRSGRGRKQQDQGDKTRQEGEKQARSEGKTKSGQNKKTTAVKDNAAEAKKRSGQTERKRWRKKNIIRKSVDYP